MRKMLMHFKAQCKQGLFYVLSINTTLALSERTMVL